jgi:hypothetical protein
LSVAPWLIVFSSEIDNWGENASQLSLDAMSSLAQRLVQGIRKVLDAGYEAVHVLTDHGFLFLGDVSESDKVSPPEVPLLKRDQRYLLGRDLLDHPTLLRFPVRGSDDLVAYYPHGVASFVSTGSYHYSHGGPTLQEAVIPHLFVQRVAQVSPVRVRLEAPDQIHNAVFKIELVPERRDLFDQEARVVRLIVERADGKVIYNGEEVVDAAEPVRRNIMLRPNDGITFGSALTLIARDAQTGEELDRKTTVAQIDLDL